MGRLAGRRPGLPDWRGDRGDDWAEWWRRGDRGDRGDRRLLGALEQRELIGMGAATRAAGAAGFWRLGALEGNARPVSQLG